MPHDRNLIAAVHYTVLLLAILLGFGAVNWVVRLSGARVAVSDRAAKIFSVLYGFIYAMMAGVLIYYGVHRYNGFFERFSHDVGVVELISVSIVATFCFLYAATFHNTISIMAGRELKLNPFVNVVGYVLARLMLVGGLILG